MSASALPFGDRRFDDAGAPALHGAAALTFGDIHHETRSYVEAELRAVLDHEVVRAEQAGPASRSVMAALNDLCSRGGKRLRPSLVSLAYLACGGQGGAAKVARAGVALELLQSYFLIHDDWMDGDDFRRGGPSAHAALRAEMGDRGLGDSLAILAGNVASALAEDVLCRTELDATNVLRALRLLSRIERDVIFGQALDLAGPPLEQSAIEHVYRLKTSAYSTSGPLAIGATLAGASESVVDAFVRFGDPIGVAFQLRDDLLGTFGDLETTGKPSSSDVVSGKRTALLAALATSDRALADRVLKGEIGEDEVETIRAAMNRSGARSRVEARINELTEEARAALSTIDISPAAREWLLTVSQVLVAREK